MSEAEAPEAGGPREHDEGVVHTLAAKIMADWLRNRQQLLVPLTLDLGKIEPAQADILIQLMVSAARADGVFDESAKARLAAAAKQVNADEKHEALLRSSIGRPNSLFETLSKVDPETGASVYAASLLAIDRRKSVNRQYLRYLAARLRLPREVTRSLEQRYTSAA